jgi:tetratricopeptide (TPR) repeat protein
MRRFRAALVYRTAIAVGVASACVVACGWNPARPFDRQAPAVQSAIKQLADGGDATVAVATLEDYLSTGPCADGNIGTPETIRKRPDGTFDLGLSLFRIGEALGKRFGEEETDGGDPVARGMRTGEVGCALRILEQIASDEKHPLELRARAHYLEGNLDFLDGHYEEAVRAYDHALELTPGAVDGGDPVGRDAAWNRAIAQRREEDKKKDAGHDAEPDSSNDGGRDSGQEGGNDAGQEGGNDGGGGGKDSGEDAPRDSGGQDSSGQPEAAAPPPRSDDAGPPPPPRADQDERILDQLESAPTVQQEAAKKMAARRRVRGTADK